MKEKINHSILVVDDEEAIREVFRFKLKRQGYDVTMAENGKEALARLKDAPFDLVLTDLEMPVMDGFELVERASSEYPTVPTIVISSVGEPERIAQAIQSGATNFLPKPVNEEVLLTIVKKGLNQRKQRLKEEEEAQRDASINEFVSKISRLCNHYEACYEFPVGITANFDGLIETILRIWKQSALYGGFQGETKNFPLFADELLSNSISYGRLGIPSSLRDTDDPEDWSFEETLEKTLKEQSDKTIRVAFSVSPDRFQVIVYDNGKGFNWRELPDNILDVLEKPHGRGVLLMRSFGAELSWNETGNEVTFTLKTAKKGR